MNSVTQQRVIWVAVPVAIGMIVPSLVVFYLQVFVGHIAPAAAVADILHGQFAEGENAFLGAVFGLIPFAALSAICARAAGAMTPLRLACIGVGGLVGILALMIPGHVSVWYPLYGPGHMSSTAVIAFFFIPFYCLVPMAIGICVGWLVSLLPIFRRAPQTSA